jgi:transposase-like protein
VSIDLTDPIFNDETAAWAHFEAIRWPDGPVCPHCGVVGEADKVTGQTARVGLYRCHECVKQFTATIGTVYERSHIPMHKWLLATHLLCASKKGISALQLFRMLGFGSYRTAWFMAHRIREAMGDDSHKATGGLGGANKVVEADETYVGGKAKNRAFKEVAPKKPVLSLVERGGHVKSFYVANVTAKMVRPLIVTNASRASTLMTDDSKIYPKIGREFDNHHAVNHSINEYVRLGGYAHTNTVENYFSIFKRGLTGVYHSVSEAHLHRYLAEFDFRYNNRSKLGVEDTERAVKAIKGAEGKRLTYRQPRQAAHV